MTKANTDGLDRFIKALKETKARARVGIMGAEASAAHVDENGRSSGLTNADIGAIHEFGEGHNPERSFLRAPLSQNFGPAMQRAGAFKKSTLAEVIKSGSFIPYLEKAAIVGVAVVLEAFDKGGANGEWPPSDMSRKKVHQTLIETQQLRDSITGKVVKGG